MCMSKGVHKVEQKIDEPELEDNDFFIGTINHGTEDELFVNLVIDELSHC